MENKKNNTSDLKELIFLNVFTGKDEIYSRISQLKILSYRISLNLPFTIVLLHICLRGSPPFESILVIFIAFYLTDKVTKIIKEKIVVLTRQANSWLDRLHDMCKLIKDEQYVNEKKYKELRQKILINIAPTQFIKKVKYPILQAEVSNVLVIIILIILACLFAGIFFSNGYVLSGLSFPAFFYVNAIMLWKNYLKLLIL